MNVKCALVEKKTFSAKKSKDPLIIQSVKQATLQLLQTNLSENMIKTPEKQDFNVFSL